MQARAKNSGSSDNHAMTTDDLKNFQEPEKMKLCEPCAGIQRNWRRAPGHAELEQGSNRQEDMRADRYSNHKHDLVTITLYSCARCGTAWEYENNKANQKAGWSVTGR